VTNLSSKSFLGAQKLVRYALKIQQGRGCIPHTERTHMKRPQKWVFGHGGTGSYNYPKDMTDDEIRVMDAARRKSEEEDPEFIE
jgi:hypothetical protein